MICSTGKHSPRCSKLHLCAIAETDEQALAKAQEANLARITSGPEHRMLLAKPKEGDMLISAEVLDIFYQELGEVLTRENVISLEEVGGRFNQGRQRVVATRATHDPAEHNIVAKSESPGYLFQERLVRPQEVVIYKFQEVA